MKKSGKHSALPTFSILIVLRFLREILFLHKLLQSLAAVSKGSFQQIATLGQSIHIDGFRAVSKAHHLFAVHAEDFHLLQVFGVEVQGFRNGIGPNGELVFIEFAKAAGS